MNPPRDNSPHGNEPTRPKDVPRQTGWPESQRMDVQQQAATQAAKANARGKAAIRASLDKAQDAGAVQGQKAQQVQTPDGVAPKGKAGVQASLYKALQAEPQKPAPTKGKGKGQSR